MGAGISVTVGDGVGIGAGAVEETSSNGMDGITVGVVAGDKLQARLARIRTIITKIDLFMVSSKMTEISRGRE